MNFLKLDTNKMRWDKHALSNNVGFHITGCVVKFTDQNYFNEVLKQLKEIGNKFFEMYFIDRARKTTIKIDVWKFLGWNMYKNEFENNPNINNVYIDCVLRERIDNLGEINTMDFIIKY